jgi:hypothetical protein
VVALSWPLLPLPRSSDGTTEKRELRRQHTVLVSRLVAHRSRRDAPTLTPARTGARDAVIHALLIEVQARRQVSSSPYHPTTGLRSLCNSDPKRRLLPLHPLHDPPLIDYPNTVSSPSPSWLPLARVGRGAGRQGRTVNYVRPAALRTRTPEPSRGSRKWSRTRAGRVPLPGFLPRLERRRRH